MPLDNVHQPFFSKQLVISKASQVFLNQHKAKVADESRILEGPKSLLWPKAKLASRSSEDDAAALQINIPAHFPSKSPDCVKVNQASLPARNLCRLHTPAILCEIWLAASASPHDICPLMSNGHLNLLFKPSTSAGSSFSLVQLAIHLLMGTCSLQQRLLMMSSRAMSLPSQVICGLYCRTLCHKLVAGSISASVSNAWQTFMQLFVKVVSGLFVQCACSICCFSAGAASCAVLSSH